MSLTDAFLRQAKGREAPWKASDGGGLFVLVQPDGRRYWRLAYRFGGKQKTLALGAYPLVSLATARAARDTAKRQLQQGQDPSELRKAEKAALNANTSFETIAREWHAHKKDVLTPRYAGQVMDRLEADVFPQIGKRQIDKIEPPELLAMLRKIEARGALTMAKRVREHCSQIFRYAIVNPAWPCKRDPCADLRGALKPSPAVKHHRAIPRDDLPELIRAIEAYDGEVETRLALKLAMLTLLRTTELRAGQWREIQRLDTDAPLWRVPEERMKMKGRGEHLVPLSRQAAETLRELQKLTGHAVHMFPAPTREGFMSNNTMLFALYRMGFHSRTTTHGFRTIASTNLNEAGFNSDAIERQLAHDDGDKVRSAYNAAEYLPERRAMLQWYADFLDTLKAGGNVVSLSGRTKISKPVQA